MGSFRSAIRTMVTKHASLNMKMVNRFHTRLQFNIHNHISRREGGAGLCDQEADAVRGVRGAQEQERAGGVLLLLLRPLQHRPRLPHGQVLDPRPPNSDPRMAV